MAYVSQLYPGERIIDDGNAAAIAPAQDVIVDGEVKTRGYVPRDWQAVPFGSMPEAEPLGLPLIPRSEWDDRIEEIERTKSRLTDLCDGAGLTVLDQNGTNYCWINAPVHCVEILRVKQGEPLVRLSPASCGGPIKGYRNVGGWGTEGLAYIVEHGIVPQEMWPPNAINRQYDTPESREARKAYKVQEWWDVVDLGQRDRERFDRLATCLLLGIPVAIGLNWWRHEITAMDLVALGGGQYGVRINNSWGTRWETNGRSVLSESKATPDDAVAPRVSTPS